MAAAGAPTADRDPLKTPPRPSPGAAVFLLQSMDRLPVELADALGPPFAAAVKLGVEHDAALAFKMIFTAAASGGAGSRTAVIVLAHHGHFGACKGMMKGSRRRLIDESIFC
jgi:hypothetical protein